MWFFGGFIVAYMRCYCLSLRLAYGRYAITWMRAILPSFRGKKQLFRQLRRSAVDLIGEFNHLYYCRVEEPTRTARRARIRWNP
ncbi:hypothetical protein F5X98DRAFT_339177 [Xylaria grammica]|nr:hypothetical protein F5X98DRAFT_339177 [Xylaria grammica]